MREGEVREGEGVVAVRSKMDVALPNSAGMLEGIPDIECL